MSNTGKILDGKTIAAKVKDEVSAEVKQFITAHGRAPGLHVVLVGDDPASRVYVQNKEKAAAKVGIVGYTHRLPANTSERDLLSLIEKLNTDDTVDGILVQLPLPNGLYEKRVIDLLDPSKDVDGLHPTNAGLLVNGSPRLVPCTPQGCMRIIQESGVSLKGMHSVVVGRSNLVGKPVAQLLLAQHATVTIAHSRTRDLDTLCRVADVLVAAVGQAKMIKGSWIKPGAVVVDVGINRIGDGTLVGDVDYEAARLNAFAITPVPGGVGPLTIAFLLKNTVVAARAQVGVY
jgi:methylenetetrahydrofolate dehydrogenase (NADP+)/methenyltetrahydrofolate cyclohydrolase